MSEALDRLVIRIEFDSYLNASQIVEILGTLDAAYVALYTGLDPNAAPPLPHNARMQLNDCRMDRSIVLEFVEGVRQVWTAAGPTLQVVGPLGAVGLMGRLIISSVKGVAELRKTWHEGSKAKYEAEEARRRLERKGPAPVEGAEGRELTRVSDEKRREATVAVFNFISVVEFEPNITALEVNGERLIRKDGKRREVSERA